MTHGRMKKSVAVALLTMMAWTGLPAGAGAEETILEVRSALHEAQRPIERPWAVAESAVATEPETTPPSAPPSSPPDRPGGSRPSSRSSVGLPSASAPAEAVVSAPVSLLGERRPAPPGKGRALRLREVLGYGLEHGREARRIRTTYLQAHDRYLSTRAGYRPWIGLDGSDDGRRSASVTKRIKRSGSLNYHFSNDGTGGHAYGATWTHPLFKTNDLPLDTAEVDWRIARLDRDLDLVDYRFRIIRQFYGLLQAQETVEVDRNAVERWKKTLDYARARFEMGITNKLDLLNNQVALGQAENSLLRDEQSMATASEALADLIGMNPGMRVWAREEVLFRPIERKVRADWIREDLAIAELRLRNARLRSRDARRTGRPDLTWSSSWTDGNGGVASDLTHGLSLDFQLGRRPAEHDARATRRAEGLSRISLEGARAAVDLEQRAIRRSLRRQEKSIRIAQESLKQAEQSVAFAQFNFEKGLARAIDLRDAQDTLTRERSSYLGLLIGYKLLGYEYQKVMGGNLDE